MQYESTLEFAHGQDAADPLQAFRDKFHFPTIGTPEMAYFSGHSLGLQPKTVKQAVASELEAWAHYGVDAHFDAA